MQGLRKRTYAIEVLEVLAWLNMVAGIIAGIIVLIGFSTVTVSFSERAINPIGIGIGIGLLFEAILVCAVLFSYFFNIEKLSKYM